MTLLRRACALLYLATLIAATKPAPVHEARQNGPVQNVTSTSTSTSTMSPTSTTPSSTGTSSATPSSSPTLILTVHNMTTCTSAFISWNYSGKAADLFLSITDIGVDQNYTQHRVKAREAFQEQLVDTNTTARNWTWPVANVPQGWYLIQASVLASPTISNNSAAFFVSNGTDVSCLTDTPSPSSSTASASASVSSSGSRNVPGIVAGVVGAVLGVAVAVLTGLWLWTRRRRRRAGGEGSSRDRKWGSLKSTSSSIPGNGGIPDDHCHSRTESTGTILQTVADGNKSAMSTPGDSQEDVATVGEEKLVSPVSSAAVSPVDALSTPMRYDRRSSIQSVQTPTSATSDSSRTRTASLHASNHNHTLEQQAHRIRSSMEASMRRRSERLSMPTVPSPGLSRPPYYQSKDEYPLSTVAATPVNRSISAGAIPMTARRASRKPVPHYDSSALLEDTNADSASTFTGGADSSQSHGTGITAGANGGPALVHKASFGDGRPLHYLIPDMPPPQQDQD